MLSMYNKDKNKMVRDFYKIIIDAAFQEAEKIKGKGVPFIVFKDFQKYYPSVINDIKEIVENDFDNGFLRITPADLSFKEINKNGGVVPQKWFSDLIQDEKEKPYLFFIDNSKGKKQNFETVTKRLHYFSTINGFPVDFPLVVVVFDKFLEPIVVGDSYYYSLEEIHQDIEEDLTQSLKEK